MNTEIWKYQLHPETESFDMPRGANVIAVDVQYGVICLWCEVDTAQPKEQRKFEVIGTGHKYPAGFETLEYIGTVKLDGGTLIFHVYENAD